MSMTLEAPEVERTDFNTEEEFCHLVCNRCYGPVYDAVPMLAVCSYDCSDSPNLPEGVDMPICIECTYVDACPVCGYRTK